MNNAESNTTIPHIAVCVCTFKRPQLLKPLLTELVQQRTDGSFEFSITIVDNDRSESARQVVTEAAASSPIMINYEVEPEQNIALARNKAVSNSGGDFVAFIDDDERPVNDWLLQLFGACRRYNTDGALGPVKPRFSTTPPDWAMKAGIFDRPNSRDYPSGSVLHWEQTGMGNALVKRSVFEMFPQPFQKEFGSGGEDIDFFRRAISAGKSFAWCAEAIAYEIVPAERIGVGFQLRRALLRGKASLASPAGRPLGMLKSISAFGLYSVLLPVSLIIGRHMFLKHLIRLCDHLGKILAALGIDVVREKYVVS